MEPLTVPTVEVDERLVDAWTASARLKIPLAWLRTKPRRDARGIPCYHIGHLVRFRLSELEHWRDCHATVVAPAGERGDGD